MENGPLVVSANFCDPLGEVQIPCIVSLTRASNLRRVN